MDTTLPGMPTNSETFLTPAMCSYKKGDAEFVSKQNAQRERVTCALALDVHYELDVPEEGGGLDETRPQPFNPRISSPACPYNYTGKFIDEETYRKLHDDPVKLGEAIAAQDPYDPPLFKMKDPRLTTKTQVIRDFGCKVPIDLVESEKLAEAVLNYYPDQYVGFLNEFVDNLFGDAMKHFLALQMDGYRKMLDNPAELNRISWGAFMAVRGKEDTTPGFNGTAQNDVTLRIQGGIKEELNKLALNGTGMTSNVNARDIYDLRDCIDQHISTLRQMHDEWCQGYATKETYALVMMYYANEQGRRLCWDKRLLRQQDTPNYDEIKIHVPTSLYHNTLPNVASGPEDNPDRLSAIHTSLSKSETMCEQIETFVYSVGRWSGSEEAANVFLNSACQAPYMWGWGHPMNLMHHLRSNQDRGTDVQHVMAPYIAYKVGLDSGYANATTQDVYIDMDHCVRSKAFVKKWRKLWLHDTDGTNVDNFDKDRGDIIPSGHVERRTGLRASLLEKGPNVQEGEGAMNFRGANDGYRAVTVLPTGTATNLTLQNPQLNQLGEVKERKRPDIGDVFCDDEGNENQVFDKSYFSCGEAYDPFLKGGACFPFTEAGRFGIHSQRLALYSVKDLVSNPSTGKLLFHAISILLEGAAPFKGRLPEDKAMFVKQLKDKYNMNNGSNSALTHHTPDAISEYIKDAIQFFDSVSGQQIDKRISNLQTLMKVFKMENVHLPFRIIAKGLFAPSPLHVEDETNPMGMLQHLFASIESITDYLAADSGASTAGSFVLPTDMSDIDGRGVEPSDRLTLKLVALRKSIQYSLGADAAYVICGDPLGTVRPYSQFQQLWNDHKKDGKWEGEFELDNEALYRYNLERTKGVYLLGLKMAFWYNGGGQATDQDVETWIDQQLTNRLGNTNFDQEPFARNIKKTLHDMLSFSKGYTDWSLPPENGNERATYALKYVFPTVEVSVLRSQVSRAIGVSGFLTGGNAIYSAGEAGHANHMFGNVNDAIFLQQVRAFFSVDPKPPTLVPRELNDKCFAELLSHNIVRFQLNGQPDFPRMSRELLKFMYWRMNYRLMKFLEKDETFINNECVQAAIDFPKLALSGDLSLQAIEENTCGTLDNVPGWMDTVLGLYETKSRLNELFKEKSNADFPAELMMLIHSMMGIIVDPRMMYYPSVQQYVKSTDTEIFDAVRALYMPPPPAGGAQITLPDGVLRTSLPQGINYGTCLYNPEVVHAVTTYVDKIKSTVYGTPTDPNGVLGRIPVLQMFLKSFDGQDDLYRGVDGSYETPYGMLAVPPVPGPPVITTALANAQSQGGRRPDIGGPVPNEQEIASNEWRTTCATPYVTSSHMSFLPFRQLTPEETQGMPSKFTGWYNSSVMSHEHLRTHFTNATRGAAPPLPPIQTRSQLFSMLDAAALLWNQRSFWNPADSHRPSFPENGTPDDMHPWSMTLVEAFLSSREVFKQTSPKEFWEEAVHNEPERAFSAKRFIGAMCDESFRSLFPLIPLDHKMRDAIRKVRSLNVLWGTLPSYGTGTDSVTHKQGAWMPLSEAHRCRLFKEVGLFDDKHGVPSNPWLPRNTEGLGRIFNQSYHSVYPAGNLQSTHFREWVDDVCRYQPPRKSPDFCLYPFSQYGGTPVEADFLFHKVEAPVEDDDYISKRHAQLVYNRFGFTKPMRLGQQYQDNGILQDLYSFEYRSHLKLTKDQKAMKKADKIFPSSFMAYARNHCILALASCNHGTNKVSEARVVRNLYRLFVDSYDVCEGMPDDSDHVPVIMGFLPNLVRSKEDRPMIMYAGSLPCLNAKLEKFCFSAANKSEKVCQNYKQTYLNDAALLFTRLIRADRRKNLHRKNYRRAAAKRGGNYTPRQFFAELVDVQDAYIEFLQTTLLSMALESDVDMRKLPLHLLEPREVSVPVHIEDTDVIGNDFLGPRTLDIVKDLKIDGDNISRTQLAILSLMPPNHRILGTLRLNHQTEIVDLEHVRKQVQKQAIEGNKKVWADHMQKVIRASLGMRFLEENGPIDFSLDETAFKDPLQESANIARYVTSTNRQTQSSVSQNQQAYGLRQDTGPSSLLSMNRQEYQQALQSVRDRVERDYEKARGGKSRLQCLLELRVPEHVRNDLRKEYQQRVMY